jgi:hypothetical protein
VEQADPSETAARVRAALAYAGIREKDYRAKVPGITFDTLKRIVSPTKPRGIKDPSELPAIQAATGVPMRFLEGGWSTIEDQPTLAEEVEALRHQVDALRIELHDVRNNAVTPDVLRAALGRARSGLGPALSPDQPQAAPR